MISAVIGAGSWGTALASVLATKGPVRLWCRDPKMVEPFNANHANPRYQTDVKLSEKIRATPRLEEALSGADLVCTVVPSHAMRSVMTAAAPHLSAGIPIICAAKGIENQTLMTMEEVLTEVLPREVRGELAFLSGPSFARETLLKMATAVTIAARFPDIGRRAQNAFTAPYFRVYTTEDVTGVELGGALKNVVAIASGVAHGLGLGHNTRAALLTRGLAEISRLAVHRGANPLTLSGLAGMGDLVLTCTGELSRNRSVGMRIGRGERLADILRDMDQVAEGVRTTQSAYQLALREEVDMPITTEVYRILYENKPGAIAVAELMGREPKRERA